MYTWKRNIDGASDLNMRLRPNDNGDIDNHTASGRWTYRIRGMGRGESGRDGGRKCHSGTTCPVLSGPADRTEIGPARLEAGHKRWITV